MRVQDELNAIKLLAMYMAMRMAENDNGGVDAVARRLERDQDELIYEIAQECAKCFGDKDKG